MKKNNFLKYLVIFITLFSLSASSYSNSGLCDFQNAEFSRITTKKSYSSQDSFYLYEINSSSDWEIIPGIIGSGSEIDPYIIKDIKHYDDNTFLYARNSEAFVLFENCTFKTSDQYSYQNADLKFVECANIEIYNCEFDSRNSALVFSNSSQFKITHSSFYTTNHQISLIYCSNFEISSNIFKFCLTNGITLLSCTESCIFSNIFITGAGGFNSDYAVSISGISYNIAIGGNEIQIAYRSGIKLDQGVNFIAISNNTIYYQLEESNCNQSIGIAQYGAKNCIIEENHIYNLGKDGILLQECENITVYQNTINNNSQNGISIIKSSIINIVQNTIVNNSNYGIFSNQSSHLNLKANIITNNQNGNIKMIIFPFLQKYWESIVLAIGLAGIEFFILIKKNSKGKIQTDRVKIKPQFDYDNSKVMKTKADLHRNFTLYRK